MKLPWNKNDDAERGTARAITPEDLDATPADGDAAGDSAGRGDRGSRDDGTAATPSKKAKGSAYTPKKGRPTPKRNEVRRDHGELRGPVKPPLTAKEARERRKEQKASMTKEELKAQKARERAERREQRRVAEERMAAGDPKYMLPRDQGPERKLVRDWVDSRRFIANIFLPFALVLLLVMIVGQALPAVANITSLVSMVLILALVIEGIWIGRKANTIVRERMPESPNTGFGLGFYAYSRASQPRRLRTPRPRVEIGGKF
ncbi:DUF3043 domain-containing protein [Corynebacterium sp. 335C]